MGGVDRDDALGHVGEVVPPNRPREQHRPVRLRPHALKQQAQLMLLKGGLETDLEGVDLASSNRRCGPIIHVSSTSNRARKLACRVRWWWWWSGQRACRTEMKGQGG